MKARIDLRLYGVLDPARCRDRDPVALAEAAVRGGTTLVQLRDKASGTGQQVALARALKRALDPFRVPLIVNDRVDVALAAEAAGVHIGQDDMAATDARRLLGPDSVLGVTVHHPSEADAVVASRDDYAGMGPVFETSSKRQEDPAIAPDGLARLIRHLRGRLPGFPVCGIAGIDAGNAAAVIEAGADGVAVISALFMAEDVEAAARELRRVVDDTLERRPQ